MLFVEAGRMWPHHGHTSTKISSLSWMSRSTARLSPTLSLLLLISLTFPVIFPDLIIQVEGVVPHQSSSPFHNLPCQTSEDCIDPNKECLNGRCHCKPYFDEIPFHTEDGTNPHHNTCRKTFGASCSSIPDEEVICNPHKLLKCSDKLAGVCVCIDEESPLTYDYYLETCAALPGNKCDLIKLSDHEIGCIRNAECVSADWSGEHDLYYGVCRCSKGYVEYGEPKRCVPKLGSKCQFAVDCNYDLTMGMECRKGKCSCSKNTTYNSQEHRCQMKAGVRCELDWENCVDGASCVFYNENGSTEWKCGCNEGYHSTESGACVQDSLDITCGNHSDDFVVFDMVRGRCSVKVGGSCGAWGKNQCVSHAFCGTENKCQCYNGYSMTGERTCVKVVESLTTMKTESLEVQDDPGGPNPIQHQSLVNSVSGCKILSSGINASFYIAVLIQFMRTFLPFKF